MAEPWEATFTLDLAELGRLIAADRPGTGPGLRVVGEGFDNLAVLDEGGLLWRVPRREPAVPLLEDELLWAPAFTAPLPIATSAPLRVIRLPGPPHLLVACRFFDGESADTLVLSASAGAPAAESTLAGLAPALGRALGRLHAAPAPEGCPLDRFRRSDLPYRRDQLTLAIRELDRDGGLPQADALCARLASLAEAAPWADGPRTVHGDLHPRHVLFDGEGQLQALIDWGDLHGGDPAQDLSLLWTMLPTSARGPFLSAYSAEPGASAPSAALLDRARFRALLYGVLLERFARATGDRTMGAVAARARAAVLAEAG